tara:strand:+ start:10182 stop:10697 length:516 start_codon:yes stop_codon:yes gene_type:complete
MKVIDRFLSEKEFERLKSEMMAYNFQWHMSKIVDDNEANKARNMQFIHMFYERHAPVDDSVNMLFPILQRLQPIALLSIKANLMPGQDRIIEHGMHIDITDIKDNPWIRTGILYMNTCDGYTKFEDDTKVESVENRFVSFPHSTRHTGTTCTNMEFRMVINFNYVVSDSQE